MELRQLRYFVKVAELGSMGRAAAELGVVTSALSQQISRLEGELATRLLQRTSTGVIPTEAGVAFWRQAQLTLRHAQDAVVAAQQARLSGHVSIGLAPSTAAVLGVPLLKAMQARYPAVRLHLVENLSGHLTQMLTARQLDLAVLFHAEAARRWSVMPLLDETLYLIGAADGPGCPAHWPPAQHTTLSLAELGDLGLILPSGPHGLRALLDRAFHAAGVQPRVVAEIDGLALLMDAVGQGLGATIQPGAAAAAARTEQRHTLRLLPITDPGARRPNLLVSLSDNELSPAALAARVVITDVAKHLVRTGHWIGARLHET